MNRGNDLYRATCVGVGLVGLASVALGLFGGSMFGLVWDISILGEEQRHSYGFAGLATRIFVWACAAAAPGVLLIRFRREVAIRWLLPERETHELSRQVPIGKLAFALLGAFVFLEGLQSLAHTVLTAALAPSQEYPLLLGLVHSLAVVGLGAGTVVLSGWLAARLSP